MDVFPQRSQDSTSTPRTPQEVSASSTRAATIYERSPRSLLEPGGADPAGQPVGSSEHVSEYMEGESTPTELRNYSGPSGSPFFNGLGPYNTYGAVPLIREDLLVDGIRNQDQSFEGTRPSEEDDTTPQPTPTLANTPVGSDQAVGIPPSLLGSSRESSSFPRPVNAQSVVTDSQTSQPPATQPIRATRRRRRFVDWLRRHRSYRHGPWAPFIRRNWNAVSDAIREVERRGFGSARGPPVDPVLVMDGEVERGA